jgi:hypothetical protein
MTDDFEMDLTSLFEREGEYWTMSGELTRNQPRALLALGFARNGIPVEMGEMPLDTLIEALKALQSFLNSDDRRMKGRNSDNALELRPSVSRNKGHSGGLGESAGPN